MDENSLAPQQPLGNLHLSPRELEIEKHRKTITDMRAAGMEQDLIDCYIKKYKSLLDPDVPFATSEYLKAFITTNPKMIGVKEQIALLSKQPDTVLIEGPTGTGKEILARALHGDKPPHKFVDINCAAIPENLIESELFGHVKGSFTGADRDKVGLFEYAETLFLDEVGELPLSIQAKLLRAIQEKTIRRVGDGTPRPVKARIVCATLRDLEKLVDKREFREDLFYRLNTFHLKLTSLADREEDVKPITLFVADQSEKHQLATNPGVHIHSWPREHIIVASQLPGNVRSIQQIVRRYQVLGSKL